MGISSRQRVHVQQASIAGSSESRPPEMHSLKFSSEIAGCAAGREHPAIVHVHQPLPLQIWNTTCDIVESLPEVAGHAAGRQQATAVQVLQADIAGAGLRGQRCRAEGAALTPPGWRPAGLPAA